MYKKTFSGFIFFILFLAFPLLSNAQEADSIWTGYGKIYSDYVNESNFEKAMQVAMDMKNYIQSKDPKDPRIALAYETIAIIFEKTGKYDSAELWLNKSLQVFLNYYKKEGYNSASIRVTLGVVYYKLNRFKEAEYQCLKADDTFKKINTTKEDRIINNYNTLSDVYHQTGNLDKSIKYRNESIKVAIRDFGNSYEELPFFYRQLAVLEIENENYEQAEAYLSISLKYAEMRNNELDKSLSYHLYGILNKDLKKYQLSKKYYLQSLTYLKKSSTDSTTKKNNAFVTFVGLGQIYTKIQNQDSALYYFTKADQLLSQTKGANKITICVLYDKLGEIYQQKKKYKAAAACYKKSAELVTDESPRIKEQRANGYISLADMYELRKQRDSADYYFKKASILREVKDFREYRIFADQSNKGDSLYYADNFREALKLYRTALEHAIKGQGEKHERVAYMYYKVGLTLGKTKEYKEAIDYMWKAYYMWESLADSRDPNCLKALNHLYEYYTATGQKDQAAEV